MTLGATAEDALAQAEPPEEAIRLSYRPSHGSPDWSQRLCGLLTFAGFFGLFWVIAFALYLDFEVSIEACKHYLKYAAIIASALVFIIVSNMMIKRETATQIIFQIFLIAAFCVANAILANWLLDDREPRLVTLFIAAKSACGPDQGEHCLYGQLPVDETLPFYTGNTICKVGREDYDKALLGQTRLVFRVHPGRLQWEWQESGCTLQF